MKNNYVSRAVYAAEHAKQSAVGRFQVYRESRGEIFVPGFSTDSDSEGIDAFIMDQTDQRMIALVKRKVERTEMGLPLPHLVNAFHYWDFAKTACDLMKREESCYAVKIRF